MNLDRKIQNLNVKEIIWANYEKPKDEKGNSAIAFQHIFKDETYIVTYAPAGLIFEIPIYQEEENYNLTRFICIAIQKKEEENASQKRIEQKNYKL